MQLQGIIFDEIASVTLWIPVFFSFFAVVVVANLTAQNVDTDSGRIASRVLYV